MQQMLHSLLNVCRGIYGRALATWTATAAVSRCTCRVQCGYTPFWFYFGQDADSVCAYEHRKVHCDNGLRTASFWFPPFHERLPIQNAASV